MGKSIGLIFPGQGSQYVGMGRDFYETSARSKEIFDSASSTLGYDIAKVIFEGPEEKLKETLFTQPSVFVVSAAILEALKEDLAKVKNVSLKDVVVSSAGHSLGEYTALYSAGVFPDFNVAVSLVSSRAGFIQDCSVKYPGAMAAILGLDEKVVNKICSDSGAEAVNFNSPGQIVIAGTVDAVEKAMSLAADAKALKVVRLNVSGAFHSSLMKEASVAMENTLRSIKLSDAAWPVYMNSDGLPTVSAGQIKNKLTVQIDNPVLWEKTIRNMISDGVKKFIEIGPGRVLAGLLRRIDRKIPVINIEKFSDLKEAADFLTTD